MCLILAVGDCKVLIVFGKARYRVSEVLLERFSQEGHVLLSFALQEDTPKLVEGHHCGGRRSYLQVGEEGFNSLPDRCYPKGLSRYCTGQQRDREQSSPHPQGPW